MDVRIVPWEIFFFGPFATWLGNCLPWSGTAGSANSMSTRLLGGPYLIRHQSLLQPYSDVLLFGNTDGRSGIRDYGSELCYTETARAREADWHVKQPHPR